MIQQRVRAALFSQHEIYRLACRYKKIGIPFLDLATAASVQGFSVIRSPPPQLMCLMKLKPS